MLLNIINEPILKRATKSFMCIASKQLLNSLLMKLNLANNCQIIKQCANIKYSF